MGEPVIQSRLTLARMAESSKCSEGETSFISTLPQVLPLDTTQNTRLVNHKPSGGSPEEEEERIKLATDEPRNKTPIFSETQSSESSETTLPGYRPRGSAQYQLVYGMDSESSETSVTSSPRSVESSTQFLLTSLPPGSGEILPKSHEFFSQDKFRDVEVESRDSGITSQLESIALSRMTDDTSLGDETLSMYSGSTVVAESMMSDKPLHQKEEESRTKDDVDGATHEHIVEEESQQRDTQSPDSEGVRLEDIQLHSRSSMSGSETPPPKPKIHPLSIYTSDSEAAVTPPYSPVEYVPEEEEEVGNVAILPPDLSGLNSPSLLGNQPVMSILFNGVMYLGSSSVDAPISEVEANRKMSILKQQAAESEPIPIVLSIPVSNEGSVIMKDPASEQPLTSFQVKRILFCARGSSEDLNDCFCLNVKHQRSGTYHCHVFRCDITEAVSIAICRSVRGSFIPRLIQDDPGYEAKYIGDEFVTKATIPPPLAVKTRWSPSVVASYPSFSLAHTS